MKRGLLVLLTAIAFGSYGAAAAFAGSAFHGIVMSADNILEDDHWMTLHPTYADADTQLEVGDVIVGMMEIDYLQSPGTFNFEAHGATFTAVFMLEVTSVSIVGNTATFTFGAAPAGAWTSLGLPAPNSPDTVLVIWDDTSKDGSATNAYDDFVDPTRSNLADALSTAVGSLVAEFGVAGGGWWTATAIDSDAPYNPDDLADVDFAFFDADLLVTHNGIPSIVWVDVDSQAGYQELAVRGGTVRTSGDRLNGVTVFGGAGNTNVYVHPTPEPSTFALLAPLAGLLYWRRRR